MQKLLNKLIAVIVTVMMVSANMAPAIVYAAESLSQNAKTKEENVEFNATINNDYNASIDVDSEGALVLNLKVSETGYLKDCVVTLKDNNYEVIDNGNLNVKSINGNVIELDEVNAGKVLNISLPIRLKKEDKVSKDVLGKDSTVTLNAIYVNEKGKEKKIEKTLTEHLEWTAESNEVVKQDLVRYIKFDNKTMISFKITDGLEGNKIPVQSKEITVNVPSLQDNKPSKVIVTGKGISYNYENDVVTIKKENAPDSEGKIVWDSQDEYMVTYIYDAQVENSNLESQVVGKVQVKGNTVEGRLENYTYELNEQVGNYVEAETSGTTELNKGYMYTNIKNRENNLETAFEVRLKANVGFKDVIDSIKIAESKEMFNSLDASNSITNKKVKIEKDNLVEILGDNGTIKVLSEDGTELGTLTKDNNELEVNARRVVIETSKVVKEGDLEVILSKAIDANAPFTKEQVLSFTELTTTANVYGYKDENENSSREISKVINLTEPTSNAQLDVSVNNLSTVVKNEDVVLTATLETNDINDALYSNVKANIVLPEEVKEINIKEAGLIYEDELKLSNISANGNVISLNLDGNQTKYSSQSTANGTVVRIVADITLDNLAPTNKKEIRLEFSNEENGEQKTISSPVGIVAPTGFVTTNSLEINGQKVTSQESNEQVIKIEAGKEEKYAKLSGTIVNNLGYEATGVTILGTIPTSGNKDEDEKDLGSNFDTIMTSAIELAGIDAEVYYSENVNELVDGNGWTENYTENAKSYKIVFIGSVAHGTVIEFSYNVKVPTNLGYGEISKATYAVYYNNNAEQGNTQNVVLAKPVVISTDEKPVITAQTILTDLNTQQEIKNNSDIKEGKILTYKLVIKNTGKEIANNIKVETNLPDGISLVEKVSDMTDFLINQYNYETKKLENTIETLEAGKEYIIEYEFVVTKNITGEEGEATEQNIVSTIIADEIEENITNEFKVNIVKGDIVGSVTSNKIDKNLKTDDIINYYLEIKNANFEEKKNIIAKIILPEELSMVSVDNNSGTDYSYDDKTRTLTYKNPTLKGKATDGVFVQLKVGKLDKNKKVSVNAKISCDGAQEESLEQLSFNLIKDVISVNLSSNIDKNNLSDTDELEYNVSVKNNGNENVTVSVSDVIPDSLRVISYKLEDENTNNEYEVNSRNILTSLEVGSGNTARLIIMTEPYQLENGRIAKIENKATVSLEGTTIDTNTLKHTIVGTSEKSSGLSTAPKAGEEGTGDEDFDNEKTEQGTYKISGQVWVDENVDGRKDGNEEKISGLTVKLYDKKTGKIAVDVNGKEQQKTTDESGKYTFVNVKSGEYTVVVEYDSLSYGLASYRVEGLLESENSDFVTAKLDEKEVAATDTIIVEDANTYNIDLGLTKEKIFDLDITKTITKVTVTNTKAKTKVYDYADLSVAKVELATANVDFATVLVEYAIRIKNNGSVAGYAKSIVDYIPEGMTFNSELNNTWYLGNDGNAYNTNLANTIINPGETKEVNLVLSRKMSGENTGTVRNTAEILISYNEYGIEDRDVQSNGGETKTENKSSADLVIGMATGREIASYTGITLGILSVIAFAVYEIKKHVISKMYNNII